MGKIVRKLVILRPGPFESADRDLNFYTNVKMHNLPTHFDEFHRKLGKFMGKWVILRPGSFDSAERDSNFYRNIKKIIF